MPFSFFCLLLVVLVLLYYFKWQVKWQFYKIRRRIRIGLAKNNNETDLLLEVRYDAFISHDNSDSHWVEDELYPYLADGSGLYLCLGQKDFLAGVPIAENIAHAINNSRKTVLVVTPEFVKSEWCLFEMHMALTVKGMDHIVIILKEEIPVAETCKTLRMILRTITYIEYPQDETGLDTFWNKLERAIKS